MSIKQLIPVALVVFGLIACNNNGEQHDDHDHGDHEHMHEGDHDHGDHDHGDHDHGHDHGDHDHGDETSDASGPATNEAGGYGDVITKENAVPVTEAIAAMGNSAEYQTKVSAKVKEACQKKGCWMMVDRGDGEEMRVTFKDYGFFVPKDIPGQSVIMEGKMYTDTTSVEMLKHYAEDAGKSPEEIAKITEPEIDLAFEATGVLIAAE